ncbi:MAG TPA: response regulator [Candidatus Eisenbacteria bacterium]|nr:response regulator [Candidatus Eisenbacteria bacterium]
MKRILIVEDERATGHLLDKVLKDTGYETSLVTDGESALTELRRGAFDLMLLDIWMPIMSGLEVLAAMRAENLGTKAIVMTSDGTPETVLRAVREQAYHYMSKPVKPSELLDLVRDTLAAKPIPPVEVISARPDWVELILPCQLEAADRIHGLLAKLVVDLPEEVRDNIGYVFSEMLRNAVEWGGGLDPNRKVRVTYVRARRMLLYRIADPGPGFKVEELAHAAVSYPIEEVGESARVRAEMGLRPGGFGILTARALVDELIYNEAHNEVLFVKYLD